MTATVVREGQEAQQEEVTVEGALNLIVPGLAARATAVDVEKVELSARL